MNLCNFRRYQRTTSNVDTMNSKLKFSIKLVIGRGSSALALGALIVGAGCGGPQKTSGGGTAGGGAVSEQGADSIIEGTAKTAPAREVSASEREDFAKAMAKYLDLKSDGTLQSGECDTASSAFKKAADANPKLREARYNQGAVLMECGRDNEAMTLFQQLSTGKDAYAPAVTQLGVAAFRKNDRAEAERQFTRAIEIDQNLNSVAARNNLAQLLRDRMLSQLGEERKRTANRAIQHLRAVLAIDGTNIQAYASLCHIYQLLGYPEMAKLVGDQAIRRAQEIATGSIEEEQGGASESADAANAGKGKAKGKKKDEPAAAKTKTSKGTGYTREMNQQVALVYNTLALIDLEKKNVTGAISNFKAAITRDPELMEARMNLAAIALNFRDYTTAEENFRLVWKAQPANYEAVIGLGVALRGNKKAEEAEQTYVAAQKIDANNPKSYFNLGLLYQDYKGGQKPELQKAQQYFRDFIAKSGAGDLKKDAQKRIKDIDEMFVALEEAAKMQAEYEKMLKEQEEQQKQMQEEEKKQQAAAGPAADPAAPAAPAPSPTAPPAAK